MVVTDPPREAAHPTRWRAGPALRLSTLDLDRLLPLLITGAVLVGLALVMVMTPIAARGDYGQWLMASRYYLGQEVPDYRTITALPPIVPALIAGIQLVVGDPVVALHVANVLLLVGVGVSFAIAGTLLLANRWVGAFSAVIGLLVTDRFLELFAFGGLLQAASMLSMCVSVAAFAVAGRQRRVVQRWWLIGAVAMALAALTHVGTGTIAVPTALAIAGLSAFTLRRVGWRPLGQALLPPSLAVAGVAGYWLLVLIPASGTYLTNPASLAYRGPDRLFSALFSYWPTTTVVAVGALALTIGAVGDLVRRRIGGFAVLMVWVGVTWGALVYSVLTGAATDYPRFATLLLAPLVVAAGAGVVWLVDTLGGQLAGAPLAIRRALVPAALVVATLVAAPLTVGRYERQVGSYQSRDSTSLTAAVAWLDDALPDGRAILTEVREGKWVEGLTGRAALFSQSVRYAFRPAEWQRSADADAILRSVETLTSGYMTAQFTDTVSTDSGEVPTGLLLRANHGGEFVDLLRVPPATVVISGGGPPLTAASLVPVRVAERTSERQVRVRTVWGLASDPAFSYTQTITMFRDGTTLRIAHAAPGHRISTELVAPPGIAITSLEITGREAVACFTAFGGSEPCVRIHAAQPGARMSETADGALRVTSGSSSRVDLLVTALTAGDASIGLSLLRPGEVVDAHDIGAALLYEPDPAYESRVRRLELLGFQEARAFGPYRVLVRSDAGSS